MSLIGYMDDDSKCEAGVIDFPNRVGGQTAQGLYEITFREKYAKINKLTETITLSSGIQTRVADKSLVDSSEGTLVWHCYSVVCPQIMVHLY